MHRGAPERSTAALLARRGTGPSADEVVFRCDLQVADVYAVLADLERDENGGELIGSPFGLLVDGGCERAEEMGLRL